MKRPLILPGFPSAAHGEEESPLFVGSWDLLPPAALVTEMAPGRVTNGDIYQVHAYALAGNGLRLAGRLKAAAAALREASCRLRDAANSYERGILCRFLGVLRWEQELIAEEAGITSWIRDIFLFYGVRPQPVPFA